MPIINLDFIIKHSSFSDIRVENITYYITITHNITIKVDLHKLLSQEQYQVSPEFKVVLGMGVDGKYWVKNVDEVEQLGDFAFEFVIT